MKGNASVTQDTFRIRTQIGAEKETFYGESIEERIVAIARKIPYSSFFLFKIFLDIWEYLWYAIMCGLCQVLSEIFSESHFGAFVKHYFEKSLHVRMRSLRY